MRLADSATLIVCEMLSSHEMLAAISNNEIVCLLETLTDHEGYVVARRLCRNDWVHVL